LNGTTEALEVPVTGLTPVLVGEDKTGGAVPLGV